MNFVESDEAQATMDSKLKLFAFSTKSTNIIKNVGYTVVSESTIKRRQFPQNSIYSHNKRYLLHCELQPKTSNHHQLTQQSAQ
jgi:hypothetical protein